MTTSNPEAFRQMLLQLRNNFLEEMPEKLDRLDQLLVAMEETGCNNELFNEFYRIVHSLKGSGGTHGLHIITTICHQLEDLLNNTSGGAKFLPALISTSFEYIDLLRTALELIRAGDTSYPQIEERLVKLRKQISPKQYTALIVDDSKLLTQFYLEALKEFPVRTVAMSDGYAALLRALTEPFDLLITTNEIPMLNGRALIGALKLSSTNNRNVKTILVTSNDELATKKHRTTDADFIVIKNASLAQNIVDTVKRALSL
ncbi:MAG: Hpt domain-containing protein [Gallionellaceae bacterium]|nr:Hpt domain-containing protein [Gallionellaceae bacterium]